MLVSPFINDFGCVSIIIIRENEYIYMAGRCRRRRRRRQSCFPSLSIRTVLFFLDGWVDRVWKFVYVWSGRFEASEKMVASKKVFMRVFWYVFGSQIK